MTIQYVKSQSSVHPISPDTTSSKKFVYLRENVTEIQKVTDTGEPYTLYEYDEAKLTKEEYEQYMIELNSTDALESIETLKTENQKLTEQIDMLMLCILEITETVYA